MSTREKRKLFEEWFTAQFPRQLAFLAFDGAVFKGYKMTEINGMWVSFCAGMAVAT